MIAVEQLQAYLRQSARQQYEAVQVSPFTLFFHSRDPLIYFNYAIPDAPVRGDLHEPLALLREAFVERGRQPRFEFIESFAPDLAPALRAAGFVEESRLHLMICTPDTYRAAPAVPGLAITILTTDSPLEDVQAFKAVQRQGFDLGNTTPIDQAEAAEFREGLGASGALLGRLDELPVGAAAFSLPFDGITEVVGVATLEPYRRRGIASALTAEAVRVVFEQGVEIACLTAGDERAGRVYERVGFRPFAAMLSYIDPLPAGGEEHGEREAED